MSSYLKLATISAGVALFCAGCERDRDQPWRKALDEGRVVRLGGETGKLTPGSPPANAPLFPAPVVVQPSPTGEPTVKKVPVDDLPIPPPPKTTQKKPAAPEDGPELGPPR